MFKILAFSMYHKYDSSIFLAALKKFALSFWPQDFYFYPFYETVA